MKNSFSSTALLLGATFLALATTLAPRLQAVEVISVNFLGDQGGNAGTDSAPILPTETAGVVAKSNWNNAPTGYASIQAAPVKGRGMLTNVVDSSGAVVPGLTVAWSGHDNWSNGNNNTPNDKLMYGYLDDGYTTGQSTVVSIRGLPYAMYDVIIYSHGDQGTPNTRQGSYFVDNVAHANASDPGAKSCQNAGFTGTFIESDGNGGPGNYLVFRGMTANPCVLSSFELAPGTQRAPFNGFQIIPVSAITNVAPAFGGNSGGTPVTITGSGFQNNAVVKFNGVNASGVIVTNATQITAITPGATLQGAVDVEVTNPDGSIARGIKKYFYFGVPATLTSASPPNGPVTGGTQVLLGGTNLVAGAVVKFGGINANSVIALGTTLTCKTPANTPGAKDIVISFPDNTSVTLPSGYTYDPPTAIGDALSFAFDNNDQNGGKLSLTPADIAGKIPRDHWNNSAPNVNVGTTAGLVDNTGAATGASVFWQTNEHWTNGEVADTAGSPAPIYSNYRLMRGYINQTSAHAMGISFRDLSTFRNCDVYIYLSGQHGGNPRHGYINVNGTIKSASLGTGASYPFAGAGPDGFFQVPDNNGGTFFPGGNYIVFPNVSAVDGTINIFETSPDSDFRMGISGVQLISLPPTITGVAPTQDVATGGATAIVTGTDFRSGVITITFGGVPATNVAQINANTYSCTVPPHAVGAVDVVMTDVNSRTGTLVGGFTYTAAPSPGVLSVTPNNGATGAATPVTINGNNFRAGATVQIVGQLGINNTNATGVVVAADGKSLTCTFPAATPALSAGAIDVKVTNSDNTTATLVKGYTYTLVPTVTGVSPNTADALAQTSVIVTGTNFASNFTNGGKVTVGNVNANNVIVVNSTTLTCTVAPMQANLTATPAFVVVTNPDNSSNPPNHPSDVFTYTGLRAPDVERPFRNELLYHYFRTKANSDAATTPTLPTTSTPAPFLDLQPHNPIAPNLNEGNYPQYREGFIDSMNLFFANPTDPGQVNNYYYEWYGYLNVPSGGVWTLSTASDDGTYFIIGNQLVVDNNRAQGITERGATIALAAGTHRFRVQYAEGGGGHINEVYWVGPGVPKEKIPQGYRDANGDPTSRGFYGEATPVMTSATVNGQPANLAHTIPAGNNNIVTVTGSGLGNIIESLTCQGIPVPLSDITFVNQNTLTFKAPSAGTTPGGAPIVVTTHFKQTATLSGPNGVGYAGSLVTLAVNGITTLTGPDTGFARGPSSGNFPANRVQITTSNPNLLPGASVTIGGNNVVATVVDTTHLTFIPPKHAVGAVDVTIINGDGQAATNTLTGGYMYVGPTITTVTPNSGFPTGGNTVTIAGTNFGPATVVRFKSATLDALATSINVNSTISLTCVVPPNTNNALGAVDVIVEDTLGGTNTLTGGYTYVPRVPEFPNVANKDQGVTAKFFGGESATGLLPTGGPNVFDTLPPLQGKLVKTTIMTNPTILNLVLPTSRFFTTKITGYLLIQTAGLYTIYTNSDDGTYWYFGDPGTQGFARVVDNNFSQPPTERSGQIYLGAGVHKFTCLFSQGDGGLGFSASYNGPDTGNVKVIIPDNVLFVDLGPAVTSVSPPGGSSGGNTPVTITGTGFDPGSTVFFSGFPARNVTVLNSTTITCISAGSADNSQSTANCIVVNPNGTAESTPFVFDATPRDPDNPTDVIAGTFFRYFNIGSNGVPTTTTSGGLANVGNNYVPDSIFRYNQNYLSFRNGWRADTSMVTTVTYPVSQNDNFLVMWNGYISVPQSGTYTFSADTDDNEVLAFGSAEILRYLPNGQGTGTPEVGSINLNAGVHAFKFAFAEGGGGFGSFALRVSGPGINGNEVIGAPGSVTQYFYRPPTWNGPTGNFSSQNSWLDRIVPDKTDANANVNESLHIRFSDGPATYTATNDRPGPFHVFKMEFNATINANNVIAGNQIQLCGGAVSNSPAGPFPSIEQRGSKSFTISTPIDMLNDMSFEGDGNGVLTLSGIISGTKAMTKNGNSTVSVTNNANTYAGTLTLNSGVLGVNGKLATTSGIVGGPAVLRGTGTVPGPITVANNGYIFPGDVASILSDGTKGTLTVDSANFSGGGRLKVRVKSTGPAGTIESDKLVLSGATGVTLGGTSVLEMRLQYIDGTYTRQDTVVMQTGLTPATTPFSQHVITKPTNYPGAAGTIQVLYVDGTFNLGQAAATGIVGTWNSGDQFPPNLNGSPYNRVVVRLNGSVTPVTVDSLTAKAEGAGSMVEWKLASEYRNAGFNLYRRAAGSIDGWTRINSAIIPGRFTDPSSKTYRFYDWAAPGSYEYRLESVDLLSNSEFYAKLAAVTIDRPAALLSLDGLETALQGANADAIAARGSELSGKLTTAANGSVAPAQNGARSPLAINASALAFDTNGTALQSAEVRDIAASAPRAAYAIADQQVSARGTGLSAPGVLPRAIPRPNAGSSQRIAKVVYPGSGVLLVPNSMLPAGFNANRVAIKREGRSVSALAVTPAGLLLYGPGYNDAYTDKDVFFLSPSSAATTASIPVTAQGLFNGAADSTSGGSVTQQFHDVYFDWNLRPYQYPPYFSSQYLSSNSTASFTLNAANATGDAGSLTVNAWSLTGSETVSPDHALQAFVNGTPVGQAVWTGAGRFVALTFQIPAGVLASGSNRVDLVTPALTGVDKQIALVNSLSLSFGRKLSGPGALEVTNAGRAHTYEVSGLTTGTVWVVDTRFADRATLVGSESRQQADGTYKVRFTAQTGGSGKYLVVPAGYENLPVSVTRRSLKALSGGAQYLATGPSQFAPAAQTLLVARAKEGLKGVFADQEQLFDYYNYGRYGPDGIRNAVRATRPQYLLLMGRTNYDYHDYSGTGVDPLCPSYLVSTTFWSQTTSDASFGDLGRGYPEVKIGRIPANDAGEAANAVRNILGNSGIPASSWRIHVTTDKVDPNAANFPAEGASLIASFPTMTWSHNYLGIDAASSADANASMTAAANGGANLLIYDGHGSAAHLGADAPYILDSNSVQQWKSGVVFIAATCTFNWVAKNEQGYHSVPIQALTQPQGGVSVSIGSTTYMNSSVALDFTKQLLTQTQNMGASGRWGDALLRTQQWAYMQGGGTGWYMDMSKTECILGDPAMPVYSKTGRTTAPGTGTDTGTTGGGSTTPTGGTTPGAGTVTGQF